MWKIIFKQKLFIKERKFVYNKNKRSFYLGRNNSVWLFYLTNRIILCFDLRSFYASVSCIKMGLDPMYTKLAVVGDVNRNGSIVLTATPPLKALGVKKMARFYTAIFLEVN